MINSILAIVTARGGSKGLLRKNMLNLAGKPLISWSIEACLGCSAIGKTVVSSDSVEILEAAVQHGAEALPRPPHLAEDSTLTVPVIQNVLSQINYTNFKYLALVQPTSPFRTSNHITEAIEKMIQCGADSVIGVQEGESSILKSFLFESDRLRGICNDSYPFMRRQDLPVVYRANGAIYIVEIEKFLLSSSLLGEKCIPFLMDSRSSLDIDSLEDLESAQQLAIDSHITDR